MNNGNLNNKNKLNNNYVWPVRSREWKSDKRWAKYGFPLYMRNDYPKKIAAQEINILA